jgi:large subunit ribosomal protein L29
MKATTLKTKTITELNVEMQDLLRELFNLRMQKGFNPQQVKSSEFGRVRRLIARIKTILHDKEGAVK